MVCVRAVYVSGRVIVRESSGRKEGEREGKREGGKRGRERERERERRVLFVFRRNTRTEVIQEHSNECPLCVTPFVVRSLPPELLAMFKRRGGGSGGGGGGAPKGTPGRTPKGATGSENEGEGESEDEDSGGGDGVDGCVWKEDIFSQSGPTETTDATNGAMKTTKTTTATKATTRDGKNGKSKNHNNATRHEVRFISIQVFSLAKLSIVLMLI